MVKIEDSFLTDLVCPFGDWTNAKLNSNGIIILSYINYKNENIEKPAQSIASIFIHPEYYIAEKIKKWAESQQIKDLIDWSLLSKDIITNANEIYKKGKYYV